MRYPWGPGMDIFLTFFHRVAAGLLTFGVATAQAGQASILVEPDWLYARLSDPGIQILDARPSSDYDAGHIPGAVSLPVDNTFGPDPRSDLVASVNTIGQLLRNAGVQRDIRVIVYGGAQVKDPARLFWVLETFGHEDVGFLDGGIAYWRQSGYALSTDKSAIRPSNFIPRPRPDRLASQLQTVVATRSSDTTIIDARTTEEYFGIQSRTGRFGHIDSALNVPSAQNLVKVAGIMRFRPAEQLHDIYAPLVKTRKVITYCNRGKDAAVDYLALRILGKNVSTYDGSWHEWSMESKLPVSNPSDQQASRTAR